MPFSVLEAAVHRHQGGAGYRHGGMVTADGKRWREAGASKQRVQAEGRMERSQEPDKPSEHPETVRSGGGRSGFLSALSLD